MKVASRNNGNVMLDEVCRVNDLQPSCRIVGQNLENLKDAKQTGFRPKANFVQRSGIGDVPEFEKLKFKT